MPPIVRSQLLGYSTVVLTTGLALLLTVLLPLGATPFPLFFAAILVSAWVGGFGAGLTATILGGLAIVMAAQPLSSLSDLTWEYAVRFGVFVLVGVFVARVTASLRNSEVAMRREREQLQVTLASIGDGVLVTDAEGRIQSLNPVAEALTGWSNQDARGMPLEKVFCIVQEANGLPAPNPATRALSEGKVVGLTNHTILIARDGSRRPIDDSAAPIRTESGQVTGVVLVFRDVSDRRRKEQLLQESEQRHRLIAELTSDYTSTSRICEDGSFVPESTTEGFTKVTGYTLAELEAQGGWRTLIEPQDVSTVQASIERLLAGKQDTSEARLRTKSGEIRWIRYLGQPVRDPSGRIVRLISAAQDITEQKRHAQLQEERLRLAAFGRDVGMALAGTASLPDALQHCAQAMVRHLDATLARIWTLSEFEDVLELQASAGLYTHLDGPHGRVPVGRYKIGKIAQERKPLLTNAVVGDAEVHDQEWARREKLVAFAGYPLVVEGRLVGVMAMFARHCLSESTLEAMATVANGLAVGIERKQNLVRLHEEREWLSVTLNSIGDAVIATDARGCIQFMNPVSEALTGWKQDQARGLELGDVFRIINEESRGAVENPVTKVLRDGKTVGLANHTLLITKDGRERPIDDSAAPIRGDSGVIRGVVLVFRDVTERRLAEQRLEEAHARISNILESITDSFVHYDRDWRLTYVNPQAETILSKLHLSQADLLGKQIWDRFPELAGSNIDRQYHKAVQDQVPVHFEEYYPPLDAWFEIRAYPSKDGLSVYSRDVTERKKTEESIREQRNWLHTTLSSIGDAVIATDVQERITFLNSTAERLTGWSQAEAQGRPLVEVFRIVNEHTRAVAENPVAKVLREGRVVGLANHTALIARDGGETPIDDSAAPIMNEQGDIKGVVLVFRDISERKASELFRNTRLAVTQILAEAPTPSEAVPRILETVCGMLDWDVGVLWSVDRQSDRLRCLDVWQKPGCAAAHPEACDRQHAVEAGVGLPGMAWESGKPLWIRDITSDSAVDSTAARAEGIHTAFCCPLCIGSKVLGVIEFQSRQVRDSSAELMDLISLLGSQVGQFLERKAAEQTLQESEERLRLALNAGQMGTWDWDLRSNEVRWSTNLEGIHGLAPGGFEGTLESFERLVHPDDRTLVREAISKALQLRADYEIEFRYVRPDGTVHWMLGKGRAFYEDDQPTRMTGIGMDITEKKNAEVRLRRAEHRYRDLVNGLDAIVWEADAESWQFIFVSQRAEQILGYPVDWWLTDPKVWFDVVHPEDREYAAQVCRKALAEGKDHAIDFRAIRADGEIVWLHNTLYFVRGQDGQLESLRGLMVDITERKRLESELRTRMEQLAEADQRKDEFLATLAHELRNPLAPIRNSLHILKHPGGDGSTDEHVREMIERQVHHMTRLVDDLLDVSRISRGKIKLRREPVCVAEVVRRSTESIRPMLEERGHELSVSLPEEQLTLEADPTRLEQVLDNLLNNAAKYTDHGGRIWLSVRKDDRGMVLCVRDTGIGIEPEMLPRVFDLFVQAERRLDAAHGGLGIGLTLVKRLVELHGGKVQARSDGPGKGTEFEVWLPLATPRTSGQDTPLRTPTKERGSTVRRRILVVDDNADAADSLAMLLRLQGHEVQVANDGPTALAIIQSQPAEVILLDIGLPGLDGFEVARRIRNHLGLTQLLLVALTGWGQEEDRRRSREAGIDHHLVKPVELDALMQLLGGLPPPSAE